MIKKPIFRLKVNLLSQVEKQKTARQNHVVEKKMQITITSFHFEKRKRLSDKKLKIQNILGQKPLKYTT